MHIIKKLFLLALALGLVQASPASISDRDIMGKKKHKEKPLVGGWTSPAGAFIPIGSDDWKLRPSSFSWNKNDCFINSWQRAADADWTNVTTPNLPSNLLPLPIPLLPTNDSATLHLYHIALTTLSTQESKNATQLEDEWNAKIKDVVRFRDLAICVQPGGFNGCPNEQLTSVFGDEKANFWNFNRWRGKAGKARQEAVEVRDRMYGQMREEGLRDLAGRLREEMERTGIVVE